MQAAPAAGLGSMAWTCTRTKRLYWEVRYWLNSSPFSTTAFADALLWFRTGDGGGSPAPFQNAEIGDRNLHSDILPSHEATESPTHRTAVSSANLLAPLSASNTTFYFWEPQWLKKSLSWTSRGNWCPRHTNKENPIHRRWLQMLFLGLQANKKLRSTT